MADPESSQGSAITSMKKIKSLFSRTKEKLRPAQIPKAEATLSNTTLSTRTKKDPDSSLLNRPETFDVPQLYSMNELWNVAYEELKSKEEDLMNEYEQKLRGDLTTMLGVTVVFSGSKLERKDLMRSLLARKIEEVKDNTWKLKFAGHEIPVKDLAEFVAGIIAWADDYIAEALSANTYASIAWAGVSLLLPVRNTYYSSRR